MEPLLLDWFEEHGRDLPWRGARDPYAILVSEVMLQQTQVERVVPRYLAWLERWPSVESLAGAGTADVIREWQGLGYNRRAVQLQRAAQQIAARLAGRPHGTARRRAVHGCRARAASRSARTFCRSMSTSSASCEERVKPSRLRPRRRSWISARPICIARVPRCDACPLAKACPSRGTRDEPARRQGPFEGSFRQRRAATLRLVAGAPQPLDELDGDAVRSLERDGLVVIGDERVALPG